MRFLSVWFICTLIPKVLDQIMHFKQNEIFFAFSDELFTKLFILIHCLFMWGKYKELIMGGWENNKLGGDGVDVAIHSVPIRFFSGLWDIATLKCKAAMAGCLFPTAARCNSCYFWNLCSRGISLTPGNISDDRNECFPALLYPRGWINHAFLTPIWNSPLIIIL